MLITLSRRTTICQSVAEVQLTGVAPLGTVKPQICFIYCANLDNNASSACHVIVL